MKHPSISLLCLLVLSVGTLEALYIDGCPLYGCRPSGSFSFYSSVPDTISLNWQSHSFNADPNAFGCTADSCSIICIDNGVFSDEKGYMSLYGENGTVRWRDPVLVHPTLAMLDNYGDVTGSDGVYLVHYDMDGKKYPIINLFSMKPIFSITLVGTTYLLMISERGCLSLRDTDAIPDASIFLNSTIQNTNGTFLPTSQPVVNGLRFYLLTEFVPDEQNSDNAQILNMQRLYAIDVHERMANIMTIAWVYNFEMLKEEDIHNHETGKTKANMKETLQSKQVLLWDNSTQTILVNLPPPLMNPGNNEAWTFWGLKDEGNDSSVLFRNGLPVTHMAKFEPDSDVNEEKSDASNGKDVESALWVSTTDGRFCSVNTTGQCTRTLYLSYLLQAEGQITSKLALVRYNDTSSDVLIFGVRVTSKKSDFQKHFKTMKQGMGPGTYVVAIDTAVTNGRMMWAFPVPGNREVKGQISGSLGADYQRKDQFIFYAEDHQSARVISVH